MSEYSLQQVPALQLPLVNKFYKHCRTSARAGRDETVYVLKCGSDIVAAVRLQPREGWYFLRSMYVDPACRGQGVGSTMLQGLQPFLQAHASYCYPFVELQAFYAQGGFFSLAEADAPAFMVDALQRYRAQGRAICLMVNRPPLL